MCHRDEYLLFFFDLPVVRDDHVVWLDKHTNNDRQGTEGRCSGFFHHFAHHSLA
jgi:hypothetical protein